MAVESHSTTATLHRRPVKMDGARPASPAPSESTKDVLSPTQTTPSRPSSPTPLSSFIDEDGGVDMDLLVTTLEERLNSLAAFGLDSLNASTTAAIQHFHMPASAAARVAELAKGYARMLAFKETLLVGGLKRAEHLVQSFETHFSEAYAKATYTNITQQAYDGLHYLDSKLSLLESHFLESALETPAAAVAAAHAHTSLASHLHMHLSIHSALESAKSRLLTYDELPIPWRDNPYIIRGYRFTRSYTDCLLSLVKIHNETCNIWTHLLGFVVMLAVAFFHYPTTLSWTDSSAMDKLMMIVFLVAAMKCLVCSTLWHTFNGICHVESKQRLACVDYTGITVLIASSIITTEYSAFYCKPWYQIPYILITAMSGLFGAIFTWHPSFDSPEGKPKRVAFFVSFAGAGIAGFVHASFLHGFVDTFLFYAPVLKSLACYLMGVVVYALLIPERWFPGGIFDYFGMSHNLWHLSVFGGIYFHYMATVKLLEEARTYSTSCMA